MDAPPRLVPLADPPIGVELYADDWLFCKLMGPLAAGTVVPQHAHEYDHVTLLLVGALDMWIDGVPHGVQRAPKAIAIKAGAKHLFRALHDGSLAACVHNLRGDGYPAVRARHDITGV